MKNCFIAISLLLCSLSISPMLGCKKAAEAVVTEDLVLTLMTTGRWTMEAFAVSGTSVVSEFSGYEFQFNRDGSVDAILGTAITKGTWKGDQSALTIQSSFPTGTSTLKRLNYTWLITKNGLTYVEAKAVDGLIISTMRLVRK